MKALFYALCTIATAFGVYALSILVYMFYQNTFYIVSTGPGLDFEHMDAALGALSVAVCIAIFAAIGAGAICDKMKKKARND